MIFVHFLTEPVNRKLGLPADAKDFVAKIDRGWGVETRSERVQGRKRDCGCLAVTRKQRFNQIDNNRRLISTKND